MKIASILTAGAILAVVGVLQYEVATAGDGLAADAMGLSPTSVFDDPTPAAPVIGGERPAIDFVGEPPQIPHDVTGMVPITIKGNACMGCHNNPAMQGKKMPGVPTSIPVSHYQNTREENAAGDKVRGQRYICTQCHAPQADVKPLVKNEF